MHLSQEAGTKTGLIIVDTRRRQSQQSACPFSRGQAHNQHFLPALLCPPSKRQQQLLQAQHVILRTGHVATKGHTRPAPPLHTYQKSNASAHLPLSTGNQHHHLPIQLVPLFCPCTTQHTEAALPPLAVNPHPPPTQPVCLPCPCTTHHTMTALPPLTTSHHPPPVHPVCLHHPCTTQLTLTTLPTLATDYHPPAVQPVRLHRPCTIQHTLTAL